MLLKGTLKDGTKVLVFPLVDEQGTLSVINADGSIALVNFKVVTIDLSATEKKFFEQSVTKK